MELERNTTQRTVLVFLDGSPNEDRYCGELRSAGFDVLRAGSREECLQLMRQRVAEISAVIVDIDYAQENDFAFLKAASSETLFDALPVLIASPRQVEKKDMRCLEHGALDFILPPHYIEMTKRRIENALRLKRATTFFEIESILRQLPSNIFLKDADGRYVFMTHYWRHVKKDDDPNWTIRGKTDLEIRKDVDNAIKAMESDREIVRTGKGMTYVTESNVDGVHDFMKLIKQPVFDDDGNVVGIVALINDVTETEMLKRELEQRAHTDDLTGLGNRRAFSEYIEGLFELDEFPIAVISADCDSLKMVNDTYGHLVGDAYIRTAAETISKMLPDGQHVYRTGGDEFIAFLPGCTRREADEYVERIRAVDLLPNISAESIGISFGTSVLESPASAVRDALALADAAMYDDKAKKGCARRSEALQLNNVEL